CTIRGYVNLTVRDGASRTRIDGASEAAREVRMAGPALPEPAIPEISGAGLTREEQALVLQNRIAFLEGELRDLKWAMELLGKDNAEIEFIASLNEKEWKRSRFLYQSNRSRIGELVEQGEELSREIGLYRRVYAERYQD
ncbi:MAG: hypothetical protein ACYTFT_08085, partial [Planctomycetota bacterium]